MRDMFQHDGEVGRDLLAVDWLATPLGPPDTWPSSLHAAVRMVLGSRFPMWMAWGPELTFFCNDAYRRDTLGAKYPWALGQPAAKVWSEVWADVEDRVEQVLTSGVATWDDKLQLFLERNGYREETYHTFSYSPLADDDGAITGLLCVVSEDTQEVLTHRRMGVLRVLGERLQSPRDEAEAVSVFSQALGDDWPDLPFHLVHLYDGDGIRVAGGSGFLGDAPYAEWPQAAGPGEPMTLVDDLAARLPEIPAGIWPVPPELAALVPIPGPHGQRYGFVVVGLNPFRKFDPAYEDFLTLLAARLGAAIAGARSLTELAAREHEIAVELQASLLPANAFDLKHLDVATYYRAGVQGTQVGGDWYDVIELDDGRTALVVGDVMGRGVRAAAVMGQLRTALRAYARLGLPPDELMASLDGLVRDLFPEQVVTCLYAVFDPRDHALEFVSAGHLPLLVIGRDGPCLRVEVDTHPPLGVGSLVHRTHRVALEPGDAVLLYTDGLVEHRGADLESGIESLRALMLDASGPLTGIPEWLARTLLPLGPADDVAVLLARVRPDQA